MNETNRILTHFAPAERVPIEVVQRQADSFKQTPLATTLLNSVLNCVFVLNAQRQIVFASRNVEALTEGKTAESLIGLRPGEALGCIHSHLTEAGCGTSEFCRECGAVKAILSSLGGERDVQECHMTRLIRCDEESLDLLVLATPLTHNDEPFSLVSVSDISHEKRRRALERIFFHDVINLAGGADGMLETLKTDAPSDLRGDLEMSHAAVHELLEEVQTQRDLAAAEREELPVSPVPVNSLEALREVISAYQNHPVAEGKWIWMDDNAAPMDFTTDRTLLKRVLGNLIKNALEACQEGQTVTVGCGQEQNQVTFSVHNPSVMPRDVQLQVFKRSFTTKGVGRGLGTYSVKLISEKYLGGAAGFRSVEGQGTTFEIKLPA
ncbi:MAG: HAMP domain-containing histidine kinase [Verrucomicrobia bacterium]|nr:HAMP domain-containing histidine kinase [Verrucomicrobiota bacterium]